MEKDKPSEGPAEPDTVPTKLPDGRIPALDRLVVDVEYSRAVDLARVHRYTEAEAILAGFPGAGEDPRVLDLQARMAAQQGRVAEAQDLWQKALDRDPDNSDYRSGLEYIARRARQTVWGMELIPTLMKAALAVVVIAFLGVGLTRLANLDRKVQGLAGQLAAFQAGALQQPAQTGSQPIQPTPLAPVVTLIAPVQPADLEKLDQNLAGQIQAASANQQRLVDQMATLQAGQQDVLKRLAASTPLPLDLALSVPGIQSSQQDGGTTIRFDEGLFLYGWALSPDGRDTLVRLGQQLLPQASKVVVVITGYRESGEADEYFDLTLMRALVAAQILEQGAGLPASMFSLQAQAGRAAPYPEDTFANRARNRTVTLWIYRAD